ncbi:Mov34/MPN/PAD-1 family protein [Lichenibacterium dinghuense]|uniref:Mov34/MPN/PAD-1 family protein n=1 Tax=Lichenibacterium dinghuense TaxID=2895977 RepID=UPI001F44826A|nr:Mov34/MPN/PAD-1 family protein [Lichenibacterium sp. 6Y81]
MSWLGKLLGDAGAPGEGGPLGRRGFEAVTEVIVPPALADRTQAALRAAGVAGNEGLVAWSGVQDGSRFLVRTATAPRQRGIRTSDGVCVVVDGDELHRLNVETFKRGERLFAQVHSHPGRAYHSEMDDRYAIVTSPGGLSLVVPDFAVRPFAVGECAVLRLSSDGGWREVGARRAAGLISLREDPA